MTSEDIKALATQTASEAVHQTFRMFGVDTNCQESVNAFRDDLVFVREMRKTTKGVKSKIIFVIVSLATVSACAAMIRGFGFDPK